MDESRDLNWVIPSAPLSFSWLHFWLPMAVILSISLHVWKRATDCSTWTCCRPRIQQEGRPPLYVAHIPKNMGVPWLTLFTKPHVCPCTKSWNQTVVWVLAQAGSWATYSGGLNDRELQVYCTSTNIHFVCFGDMNYSVQSKNLSFLRKKEKKLFLILLRIMYIELPCSHLQCFELFSYTVYTAGRYTPPGQESCSL